MPNRHLSRIILMQSLYEWDFRRDELDINKIIKRNVDNFKEDCDKDFIKLSIKGIMDNITEIDEIIAVAAPEWPIDQIAVIDKTILRIAVFELTILKDVPPKVAINEAVELAKSYGSENSSKFVNGVLGNLYKQDSRYEDEEKNQETLNLLDLTRAETNNKKKQNKNHEK